MSKDNDKALEPCGSKFCKCYKNGWDCNLEAKCKFHNCENIHGRLNNEDEVQSRKQRHVSEGQVNTAKMQRCSGSEMFKRRKIEERQSILIQRETLLFFLCQSLKGE